MAWEKRISWIYSQFSSIIKLLYHNFRSVSPSLSRPLCWCCFRKINIFRNNFPNRLTRLLEMHKSPPSGHSRPCGESDSTADTLIYLITREFSFQHLVPPWNLEQSWVGRRRLVTSWTKVSCATFESLKITNDLFRWLAGRNWNW